MQIIWMKMKKSIFSALADFFGSFTEKKYMFPLTFLFDDFAEPSLMANVSRRSRPHHTTPHSGLGCVELVDMIETHTDGIWLKI